MLKSDPPSKNAQAEQSADREQLGRAIGRLTSGVYVLTLERAGEPEGILMTWIGQAAFEPPLVTVAVKKDRPVLEQLPEGSHFVVNVLAKTNNDIFKNFAKPHLPAPERFAGLPLLAKNGYGPVFASTVAYLNCTVSKGVEVGDHYLLVAEVVGGAVLDPEAEPMSHLRKSGFQY
jgi:flavin reductase (DIM6/NTAB) family NADH-FMN oxidoreductase RutF